MGITRRLAELARIAEGELVGEDIPISGVADIDRAAKGDITYAVNNQYVKGLRSCKASAVVVPLNVTDIGKPIIRTSNPYWSFAKILEVFSPEQPAQDPPLHPLANVSPEARIGEGVVVEPFVHIADGAIIGDRTHIGAFSYIGPKVIIGSHCRIYPHVVIRERCRVGSHVIVQSGSVIGSDGYGFVLKNGQHYKIPQIGIVEIHDHVEIGANVTIDRATMGKTLIGEGCKLDNLVQIGHNVEVNKHTLMVAQVGISGSTKIGPGCRFAGQSATSGHLAIGENCTIGARAVVTKDLPANSFVSGFPAHPHREELRQQASLRSLPDVIQRLRQLEKQVEQLETKDQDAE